MLEPCQEVVSKVLRKARVRIAAKVGASLLALSLAACTAQPGPDPTPSATADPATFNFGTGSNPLGLDPALVADSESYRVTRQIMEGLVTVDPTTYSMGRFASLTDPEGNPIQLWEPADESE